MKTYMKAWGIALIVLAVYSAMAAEIDYRAARIERCAVVHCS